MRVTQPRSRVIDNITLRDRCRCPGKGTPAPGRGHVALHRQPESEVIQRVYSGGGERRLRRDGTTTLFARPLLMRVSVRSLCVKQFAKSVWSLGVIYGDGRPRAATPQRRERLIGFGNIKPPVPHERADAEGGRRRPSAGPATTNKPARPRLGRRRRSRNASRITYRLVYILMKGSHGTNSMFMRAPNVTRPFHPLPARPPLPLGIPSSRRKNAEEQHKRPCSRIMPYNFESYKTLML
ncbi:hypothetical protein EVAR_30639_1 [Eumeta japonica]|uniref:Uncharacterized protein n=1 Tax=Eumeta variegata TaxID=151549 RepID=A0A4C1VRA9_EUMVA|nr:hypothetical protein EVAR_30639_1 [Eumeta japonica]